MKSKLILALLLAVALITPFPTFAHAPKSTIKATHRIEMHVADEGDICSATSISQHALLTATHCDLGADTVTIDGHEARITNRIKDGHDHTIYVVDEKFTNTAELSHNAQKPGDDVWIRGNPDGIPMLVRKGVYAGTVIAEEDDQKSIIGFYDLNGWHGDSGAAIFDKHGAIVGVVSFGFVDDAFQLTGAYPIAFTEAQLQQAGVEAPASPEAF